MHKMFTMLLTLLVNSFVLGFAQVFESNGTDNFPAGQVEISVNGTSKGKFAIANRTLGAVIKEYAKAYGLRTFSVYADGRKLDTTESIVSQLCSVKQLDLVAKDSRGIADDDFTFAVSKDDACNWANA